MMTIFHVLKYNARDIVTNSRPFKGQLPDSLLDKFFDIIFPNGDDVAPEISFDEEYRIIVLEGLLLEYQDD